MHRSSSQKSTHSTVLVFFGLLVALAGCVRAGATRTVEPEPALAKPEASTPVQPHASEARSVTIDMPGLYPETVVYDEKHDAFLVGSVRDGAVHRIDDEGGVRVLVRDERLISVLGIALDEARDRLWVTNSDIGSSVRTSSAGPRSIAAVGVYRLSTGEAIDYIDLTSLQTGPHLINGIALDGDGNAYLTDSFSPAIYKVDVTGRPSLFVRDERFVGEAINLNGVVVHPDGYLLVVKKSDGALFKVPLATPEQVTRVAMQSAIEGGDGLLLTDARQLLVVANRIPTVATNAALALSSDDGWASAKLGRVTPLGDVYPTTATVRAGRILVLHSKLNQLMQAPAEQKAALRTSATLQDLGTVNEFRTMP